MEKTFILKSDHGMHARPAANLVRFASTLAGDVKIKYNEKVADVKSIMAVMGLALPSDASFTLIANEDDLAKLETYLHENELI
ncbi:MAG: HPr family phosphocarrier protein [Acholeplasma sp.]|nr:HPr family phosphocarrier protein [Acholeplasma sp.]